MTKLEQAWREWRALSSPDRARSLTLLREAYARQREAVVRRHGVGARGVRVSRLADLALTKTDLQRLRP